MQELYDGRKVIILSVWDRSQTNDKNAVDESQRACVTEQGEGVRVGRFGGEGTGAQSFYDYDWKIGEALRFLVQAQAGDGFLVMTGGETTMKATKLWSWMENKDAKSELPATVAELLKGAKGLVR